MPNHTARFRRLRLFPRSLVSGSVLARPARRAGEVLGCRTCLAGGAGPLDELGWRMDKTTGNLSPSLVAPLAGLPHRVVVLP